MSVEKNITTAVNVARSCTVTEIKRIVQCEVICPKGLAKANGARLKGAVKVNLQSQSEGQENISLQNIP